MAVSETIQEILDGIDESQYGRDMRDYIHKGIQKCYEEGSAGETDLQARTDIASLQALTPYCFQITVPASEIIRKNGSSTYSSGTTVKKLMVEVPLTDEQYTAYNAALFSYSPKVVSADWEDFRNVNQTNRIGQVFAGYPTLFQATSGKVLRIGLIIWFPGGTTDISITKPITINIVSFPMAAITTTFNGTFEDI